MLPASLAGFRDPGAWGGLRVGVVLSENQVRRHSRKFVHALVFIHFVFFRN